MNPYGMTQVDVPGLLAGYENQKVRRFQQLLAKRQDEREQAEFDRKQSLLTILSRARQPGVGKPSGMGAAYSPPTTPAAPVTPAAAPGNLDLTRRPVVGNPDGSISTVRSISIGTEQGEVLIPTIADDGRQLTEAEAIEQFRRTGKHLGIFRTPEEATAAAQRISGEQGARFGGGAAPEAVPATWMEANKDLVQQLMAVEPTMAFQMVNTFRAMDKDQLEQVGARNKAIGVAAQYLLSIPQEQWGAEMQQRIAPSLLQQGVSQEQIAGFQLTPENVKWAAAQARDIEHLIDDTRIKWHQRGEQPSFATDAMGNLVEPAAVAGVTGEGPAASPATPSPPARGGGLVNNDGAIKDGPFARSQPGYAGRGANGFAKFSSPEAGRAAHAALLRNDYLGKGRNTPRKIVERYAPRGRENSDASVNNYIAYIARRLGIGPDDVVSEAQLPILQQAMREFETGKGKSGSHARAPVPPPGFVLDR